MYKLLISGDGYIYKCNNEYYYPREDDQSLYGRYLNVFDEICLVVRVKDVKQVESGYIRITDPRISINAISFFQGTKQFIAKLFSIFISIKKLKKTKFSAAIYRLPSISAFCVWFILRDKIPYATEIVYDAHDGYVENKGVNRLIWRVIDWCMVKACNNACGVSCVTEKYLQRRYFTMRIDGFSSNYSSLDLPKGNYYHPLEYKNKAVYVISHIANQIQFNGRKGVKELITAVSIINNQETVKVAVNFAGTIYSAKDKHLLDDYIEQLGCSDYVHFVGPANREEVFNFLRLSDVFVLPTRSEGLPRVVIEAMANGLPCVSTRVSGLPELLDAEWLVDYDNINDLASKIIQLISNADCYEKASIQNFTKSLEFESSILQGRRNSFYTSLRTIATEII